MGEPNVKANGSVAVDGGLVDKPYGFGKCVLFEGSGDDDQREQ